MLIYQSPLGAECPRRREQLLDRAHRGGLGGRDLAQRTGNDEQGLGIIDEEFEPLGELQLRSTQHFADRGRCRRQPLNESLICTRIRGAGAELSRQRGDSLGVLLAPALGDGMQCSSLALLLRFGGSHHLGPSHRLQVGITLNTHGFIIRPE